MTGPGALSRWPLRVVHAGVAACLALALLACGTTRTAAPPSAEPRTEPSPTRTEEPEPPPAPPPVEVPPPSTPEPCVCIQAAAPKLPPIQHKPKPKEPVKEPEPQPVETAPAPKDSAVDAEVGRVDVPLTSILGKNVKSPKGEGLGRVVDVLADHDGRVRVAIIDFGGFLGVGTRRIAVDWPLLQFSPQDKDNALILTVTRQKLQSAPEYKDSENPRVLMPPTAVPNATGAGAQK